MAYQELIQQLEFFRDMGIDALNLVAPTTMPTEIPVAVTITAVEVPLRTEATPRVGPTLSEWGVGGPEGSKEAAARRRTEATPRVGPTLSEWGVGGPEGSKEAAARR